MKEKDDTIDKIYKELRQYKKFESISNDHLMHNIKNKVNKIIEESTNYESYIKKLKEFIFEVRKFKEEERIIEKKKKINIKREFLSYEEFISQQYDDKIKQIEEQRVLFEEREKVLSTLSFLERNTKFCFHFHYNRYEQLYIFKEILEYQINSKFKILDENFLEKIKLKFQFLLKYENLNCKLYLYEYIENLFKKN